VVGRKSKEGENNTDNRWQPSHGRGHVGDVDKDRQENFKRLLKTRKNKTRSRG